ncbi:MAG: bis(5'-nucleosyl)-tetraphosphatase (symmetrical) YqeK [Eubacteriales bacterium]|nr:bis(5'-nucleosyl)-tetraphosphatase (symmetrical) YqeK [Eubacteriales bacterium]
MDGIFAEHLLTIRKELKKKLSPSRYEHTLGVSFTSAALAMRYGENIEKAELAGLLHDCGKYGTEESLVEKCDRHGVFLSREDLSSPAVIHGKYGCYLAKTRFGVRDADILNSISYHTTGRAGMSLLEKIVFIADYIEPSRDKAPDLPSIRELAFTDIDRCMYEILEGTVAYLEEKGVHIHKDTLSARDWFKKNM